MRLIKIKKKDLKKTPQEFLKLVGATSIEKVYPSQVHVCKEDYKELEKNLAAKVRKELNIGGAQLKEVVSMTMLGFGPNTSEYGVALKPGFVLVDDWDIYQAEVMDSFEKAKENKSLAVKEGSLVQAAKELVSAWALLLKLRAHDLKEKLKLSAQSAVNELKALLFKVLGRK